MEIMSQNVDLSGRYTYLIQSYETLRAAGAIKNWSDLASLLGINRTCLSAAKQGDERYLTESLVSKIRGVMSQYETSIIVKEVEPESILVIPAAARGGSLGDFADSVMDYECERMISPIKGAEFAIQVTGDSMSPEYPNGSRIIIKRINEDAFVEWGKVYVLDTDNGAVIKQIRKTDNPDVVECVSLNSAYQPFTIKTSFIKGWYRVLMVCALK